MPQQPAVERSERERDALDLAAQLSERARAEGETARLLAEHIAAMGAPAPPRAVETAAASGAAPRQRSMQVGCRSCDLEVDVPLSDPEVGAVEARRFFARHAECLTFVDLDPIRRAL